jgi:hypothetical protein
MNFFVKLSLFADEKRVIRNFSDLDPGNENFIFALKNLKERLTSFGRRMGIRLLEA